jgi:hypothetical protein
MTNASIATASSDYINISANTLTGYNGTSLRFRMEVNGARGDAGELYLADTIGHGMTLNPLGLMRGNTADYVFRWDTGVLYVKYNTNVEGTLSASSSVSGSNLVTGSTYINHDSGFTKITNYTHGGGIYLQGENASGDLKTMFYGDPDNKSSMYYAGAEKIATTTDGVDITGAAHIDTLYLASTSPTAKSYKLVTNLSGDYVSFEADSSDIRLKRNIKKIENALDKVMALNGYTFRFTKKGKEITGQDPRELRSGLIAQEVEKVFRPPVRTIGGTEYLSLKYEDLTGLLVEAIKELNIKIDQL